ncbi:MAG: hypothetical protein Faunusvirus4_2 [Faunusvirus sp.]|jgi:hypothetical protein|uniref:Uncharacterized protein n=1 Tax=Faunusvirus sp. TaxID=2487766 RepID=A0A3G4ZYT2_9VIRU|nr:MAG: hypothetical protein Faunusvirus4_2 [Faunusvirus sp.]
MQNHHLTLLLTICSGILYVDASQATISARGFVIPYKLTLCSYPASRFTLGVVFNTTSNIDDKVSFLTMTTNICTGPITDPFNVGDIMPSLSIVNKSHITTTRYIDNPNYYFCFMIRNEEQHSVTISYKIITRCDISTQIDVELIWFVTLMSLGMVIGFVVICCRDKCESHEQTDNAGAISV